MGRPPRVPSPPRPEHILLEQAAAAQSSSTRTTRRSHHSRSSISEKSTKSHKLSYRLETDFTPYVPETQTASTVDGTPWAEREPRGDSVHPSETTESIHTVLDTRSVADEPETHSPAPQEDLPTAAFPSSDESHPQSDGIPEEEQQGKEEEQSDGLHVAEEVLPEVTTEIQAPMSTMADSVDKDTGSISQDTHVPQEETSHLILPLPTNTREEEEDVPPHSPKSFTADLRADIGEQLDHELEPEAEIPPSPQFSGTGSAIKVTEYHARSDRDGHSDSSSIVSGKTKEEAASDREQDRDTDEDNDDGPLPMIVTAQKHRTISARPNRRSKTRDQSWWRPDATSSTVNPFWWIPGSSPTTSGNQASRKRAENDGVRTRDFADLTFTNARSRLLTSKARSSKHRPTGHRHKRQQETIVHVVETSPVITTLPTQTSPRKTPINFQVTSEKLMPHRPALPIEGDTEISTERTERPSREKEPRVRVRGGGDTGESQPKTRARNPREPGTTHTRTPTHTRTRLTASVQSKHKRRDKKTLYIERTRRTPRSWKIFAWRETSVISAEDQGVLHSRLKRTPTSKVAQTDTKVNLTGKRRDSTEKEWFARWIKERGEERDLSVKYDQNGQRIDDIESATRSIKHRKKGERSKGRVRGTQSTSSSHSKRSTSSKEKSRNTDPPTRRLTKPTAAKTDGTTSKFSAMFKKFLLIPDGKYESVHPSVWTINPPDNNRRTEARRSRRDRDTTQGTKHNSERRRRDPDNEPIPSQRSERGDVEEDVDRDKRRSRRKEREQGTGSKDKHKHVDKGGRSRHERR